MRYLSLIVPTITSLAFSAISTAVEPIRIILIEFVTTITVSFFLVINSLMQSILNFFSLVPAMIVFVMTLLTRPTLGLMNRIFFSESVSLRARIFSIKFPSTFSILGVSNYFKVRGINATSIPTKMIQVFSLWNFTDQKLIRYSVSGSLNFIADIKGTIAETFTGDPVPTSLSFFDFRPKSFLEGTHGTPYHGGGLFATVN